MARIIAWGRAIYTFVRWMDIIYHRIGLRLGVFGIVVSKRAPMRPKTLFILVLAPQTAQTAQLLMRTIVRGNALMVLVGLWRTRVRHCVGLELQS